MSKPKLRKILEEVQMYHRGGTEMSNGQLIFRPSSYYIDRAMAKISRLRMVRNVKT